LLSSKMIERLSQPYFLLPWKGQFPHDRCIIIDNNAKHRKWRRYWNSITSTGSVVHLMQCVCIYGFVCMHLAYIGLYIYL
jgi:hypothetical protein